MVKIESCSYLRGKSNKIATKLEDWRTNGISAGGPTIDIAINVCRLRPSLKARLIFMPQFEVPVLVLVLSHK